jgi:hypothetical protein
MDESDAANRTFRVDLTHALPTQGDAAVPPDVAARRAILARAAAVVPHSLTEEEALRLAMASALRDPRSAIGVLFGARFLRDMGNTTVTDLALTADEYGALLAVLPPHTLTAPFDALEREDGLQRETTGALATACQTTMLSDAIRVAWRRSVVRTAAAVALRTENSVPMLVAVLGESSRSDARRVDSLLSDIQDAEEESDEHLQPVCDAVHALAAALGAR